MKKICKLLSSLSLLVLVFSSCNIGLGQAVDLLAPNLQITKPEFLSSVRGSVQVEGSVSDNVGVTELNFRIEESNQDYKLNTKENKWRYLNTSTGTWDEYVLTGQPGGTTNIGSGGDTTSFTWSLSVDILGAVSGNGYTLVTQAYDESFNEGKNSKDERTIYVDSTPPICSVYQPSLITDYTDVTNALTTYLPQKTTFLTKIANKDIEIKGSQREDTKTGSMVIYFDTETNTSKTDYENSTVPSYCKFSKKISDASRNWSLNISANEMSTVFGESALNTNTAIRIITKCTDNAGNTKVECQGWFIYNNTSDIPWVDVTYGDTSFADSKEVAPSTGLIGQAYDDDGLKEVIYSLYKTTEDTDTGWEPVKVEEHITCAGNPTNYSFSITGPSENCKFKVIIYCKDKNNVESDSQTRYMKVSDTTPPSIELTSPSAANGDKLLTTADKDGNITFKGKVYDDGSVSKLIILRIKQGNESSLSNYLNTSYTEWSKATENGYTAEDTGIAGNKMWLITLGTPYSNNNKNYKDFSKKFNLFTDFGIGPEDEKEKLSSQTFMLFAEDNAYCRQVETYTFGGDTETPSLSIEGIKIFAKNSTTEKETQLFHNENGTERVPEFKPFERDASQNITDKAIIYGTFNDNSIEKWTPNHDATRWNNLKIIPLTLKWSGSTVTVAAKISWNSSKKCYEWQTEKTTLPEDISSLIEASLIDYAGNNAKETVSYSVKSDFPSFKYIISDKPDGYYKAGEEIDIKLEFTNKVKISNTTAKLNIKDNNGKTGTAEYVSGGTGDGSETIVYKYTVKSGDTFTELYVNKNSPFDLTNVKFTNKNNEDVNFAITDDKNLNKFRKINVDTTAPKYTAISSVSPVGSYSKNKELYFTMKFNESIKCTDLSAIKLKFDNLSNGTSSCKLTGDDTLLFTYEVPNNDNLDVKNLQVIGFEGKNNITDLAGNAIAVSGNCSLPTFTGINIDTKKPEKPTITVSNNPAAGKVVYTQPTVTITYDDDTGTKEYSVDNGKTWTTYSDPFPLSTGTDYQLQAKHTDAADNKSEIATYNTFSVQLGNIYNNTICLTPKGDYTTGKSITIYLNFSMPVYSTNAKLVLNSTKEVPLTSGNGTNKFEFTYVVADGDNFTNLNITSLEGNFSDASSGGTDISNKIKSNVVGALGTTSGINIDTTKPQVNNVSLNSDEETLTITFDSKVNLASGDFIITQRNDDTEQYRIPAVLSSEDYKNFQALSENLKNYYISGTNGSNSSFTPDLTEKFILDYQYDDTNSTIRDLLVTAGALERKINVRSSSVILSDDKKEITISLTDSNALRVKGATYYVNIPAGIVKDEVGNVCVASSDKTITMPGIEKPYIRINKARETYNSTNKTFSQPTTANVKVNCQTPGATSKVYTNTTSKTAVTTLGDDNYTGDTFKLYADATKNNTTETNYEVAYKTVVRLEVSGGDEWKKGTESFNRLWIRGGDQPSGGVLTPGFPLSWEPSDFDKVRPLTMNSSNSNQGYWVTWSLSTTAWVQPIITKDAYYADDVTTKGPTKWGWACEGYVGNMATEGKVTPGTTNNIAAATSSFAKHIEYRDENDVVHKRGYK